MNRKRIWIRYCSVTILCIAVFSCKVVDDPELVSYNFTNASGVMVKFLSITDEPAPFPSLKNEQTAAVQLFYGKHSFAEIGGILGPKPELAPVKVVFNNTDTVIHYNDSLEHDGKYLNKISERCIYSEKAYTVTKNKQNEIATYTFTSDDYEFAHADAEAAWEEQGR